MLNTYNNFSSSSTDLLVPATTVTVPANFLGFHFNRYPDASSAYAITSPAPTVQYNTVRSHDGIGMQWRKANPTQGVYDWSDHDKFFNHHFGLGKEIVYTLYGTPTWAAGTTDATFNDLYNYKGGAGAPTNMQHVVDFINALLTRYAGKIKHFEIWNEPTFTGSRTGTFWWGTLQEMLTLAKTVYDTVKAKDSTIKVWSPGFTAGKYVRPTETTAYQFLSATHAASSKKGHELCDVYSVHPYTMLATNTANSRGTFNEAINLRFNPWVAFNQLNSLLGTSKDMVISEWGISPGPVATEATSLAFNALQKSEQAVLVWRTLALAAIQGYKSFYVYGYDSGHAGNFCTYDTREINQDLVDIVNEFNTTIPGKTITAAKVFSDGRIYIKLSTGLEITK